MGGGETSHMRSKVVGEAWGRLAGLKSGRWPFLCIAPEWEEDELFPSSLDSPEWRRENTTSSWILTLASGRREYYSLVCMPCHARNTVSSIWGFGVVCFFFLNWSLWSSIRRNYWISCTSTEIDWYYRLPCLDVIWSSVCSPLMRWLDILMLYPQLISKSWNSSTHARFSLWYLPNYRGNT